MTEVVAVPARPAHLSPSSAGSPSRRTVIAAGAWAVPAITLVAQTPAFAASGQETLVLTSAPAGVVPATGATPITASMTTGAGAPATARPVSLAGPTGSTFGNASGVTDGAGKYATTLDLGTPWADPGRSITVSAVSGAITGSGSFTVLGANLYDYSGGGQQAQRVFPSPVVRSASGATTDLVVLQDGTVWSRNAHADGSAFSRVAGISDAVSVTVMFGGVGTFYALRSDGTVWGWGGNAGGQLGDGTTRDRPTPAPVPGLTGVTQISASNGVLYALKSDKTLWALGANSVNGSAGIGSTEQKYFPLTQVVNGTDVASVTARLRGGYFIKTNGELWSWGQGAGGSIGDGLETDRPSPVGITAPDTASVHTGLTAVDWNTNVTFCIKRDGGVYGWGMNTNGQLLDGTTTNRVNPVHIPALAGMIDILPSAGKVYGLKADGSVWMWGGNGTTLTNITPTRPVTRLSDSMFTAYRDRGFLITGGTTLTVGVASPVTAGAPAAVTATVASGTNGVAGAPLTLTTTAPATLAASSGQTTSAGTFSTTLTTDAWTTPGTSLRVTAIDGANAAAASTTVLGANMYDFTGNSGAQAQRVFPSPVVRSASGATTDLVVLQDGTVWSRNSHSDGSAFTRVAGITNAVNVTVLFGGVGTSYALKSDGTVWGWGGNSAGQLGDGTTRDRSTPAPIPGLTGVTQISAGQGTFYALKSDKTLWALGATNVNGQAGVGIAENKLIPLTQVINGTDVAYVAGRIRGGHFIKTDGSVWSWGQGSGGSIGDGLEIDRPSPVKLTAITGVASIHTGLTAVDWSSNVTFAIKTDGTVWGWGMNTNGQLLNGTTTNNPTPTRISALTGITHIVPSSGNVYARQNNGTLFTWGANGNPPVQTLTARTITRLSDSVRTAYRSRVFLITP